MVDKYDKMYLTGLNNPGVGEYNVGKSKTPKKQVGTANMMSST